MISRKIVESEIWNKPPLYLKVWIYLLMKAQHQKYKGLKRGQLRTSIPEIQEACTYYVGFRKVTPSKKEVWSVIDFLRSTQNGNISRNPYEENAKGNNEGNMIETTKATQGLLVTICNYNVYQDPKHYEGNAESPHEWNDEKDMKGTAGEQYKGRRYKNDKNVSDARAREDNSSDRYGWEIESILAYLNDKTGKKFKRTASNKRVISARLDEGYSLNDLRDVVDNQCSRWLDDPERNQYLAPALLFDGDKIERYLNSPPAEKKQNVIDYARIAEKIRKGYSHMRLSKKEAAAIPFEKYIDIKDRQNELTDEQIVNELKGASHGID